MKTPDKYIKTQSDRDAVASFCYWDDTEALKFKEFYEKWGVLTESCFAGQVGDTLKVIPWQWDEIILPWFSWRKPDGSRLKQKLFCFVPKKQNKSGLIALFALFHAFTEPAALCQIFASNQKQSKVIYNFAANTVRYGPLAKFIGKGGNNKIWLRENEKKIVWTTPQGIRAEIQAMASTPEGVSGPSASLVICDEISEWGGTHARTIWDRLQSSTAARSGQHMVISTPQFDREHIGFELWSLAKSLIDSDKSDPSILPIIYTVPEDAKCLCTKCKKQEEGEGWHCPEWWLKANPSIGYTTPQSYLEGKYREVQNNPMNEASFRTLTLGQWVGHAVQWIPSNIFGACRDLTFTEDDLHGKDTMVGIDMAYRYDLAAYVLAVQNLDQIYLLPRIFIPEKMATRKERMDRVPYSRWEKQGLLYLTEGDVIDPSFIREKIVEDSKNFNFLEVRFDKYGMEETRQILADELDCEVMELPQTPAYMGPPTAYFEQLVREKRIHWKNDILSWCVGNCTPKKSGDSVTVDKMRSTGRIDAAIAAIIALSGFNKDDTEFMEGGPCVFI